MHKITASLYKNPFHTTDKSGYVARVEPDLSLSVDDICRSAVARGGHSAAPETMAYHVEAFIRETAYQILNNAALHTEYFRIQLNIKGVVDNEHDAFDPERQSVVIDIQPTRAMQEQLNSVEVAFSPPQKEYSCIDTVAGAAPVGAENQITSQGMVAVTGKNIRIAGDSPENGVYFTNVATGETFKVEAGAFARNTRKNLLFFAPDLPAGEYRLRLTTQDVGGGKQAKTLRHAVFHFTIGVLSNPASRHTP
jgi:hypothetical protein